MQSRVARLSQFFNANTPIARVTVAEALGSTPRETGAWMLVSENGMFGTIGGGQLELMAIGEARSLLANDKQTAEMNIPLGPEIGQCCGGRVKLDIDLLDERAADDLVAEARKEEAGLSQVYIFGAGHVGKALAEALSLLPIRAILVETRQGELDSASADVEKRLSAMPESLVAEAAPGSAFVVLTHDHALDFLIVQQALARTDAAYVGMIGSKTKRATYLSWHEKEGGARADCDRLVCPIGGNAVRDKRPQVIAALVAAEVATALLS
ncbi:xanthine dehydrogenase accessory protein XdhC [Hoeflea poritis]|uniref:Xanthine dehydrogenase accessory protein XdhC n=1 Tax=Hoeflea poritis TaxID=2993659 RepID=A0ABT4VN16_9HYPH|nr:xanthine dehydrogenase accessory protein XdhC [Hoeflea poritis]MDA4846074.1 xanthine dehydrogenase accessory protein XdhC [Hoeflea poritis]